MGDKLDSIDDRIAQILRSDGRMPVKTLARIAEISEATARARLTRLQARGALVVRGIAHPQAWPGSIAFFARVEVQPGTTIEALAQTVLASAPWLARVSTAPIFIAQLTVPYLRDIPSLVDNLRIPEVLGITYTIAVSIHAGRRPMYAGASARTTREWRPRQFDLDDIDREVLVAVMADGRVRFTDLAKSLDITIPTARRRVLRLIETDALRIQTSYLPDNEHLVCASVQLQTDPSQHETLLRALIDVDGVNYVTEISGDFDVACDLTMPDLGALANSIKQILRQPGIRDSRVESLTQIHKQPSWGTENTFAQG